jgi:hypothetical protein
MNRLRVFVTVAAAAAMGGLLSTVAIAGGSDREAPRLPAWAEGLPISEELAGEGVVWHGNDLGTGERVLLVLGGAFQTREEAEQANATISLGDLQGYYVAATDQFEGLRDHLGNPASEFVLVTAFRTEEGATDFIAVARANDAPAVLTPRLLNRGYEYVGLGQEPHPNGKGPLIGPLVGVTT